MEAETFLVQIETLFITHFIDKRQTAQDDAGSSYLHEPTVRTFTTSVPSDSITALDYDDSEAQSFTNASNSHSGSSSSPGSQVMTNAEVGVPQTQSLSAEDE